jgi:HK97 gp10 family phage protein
VSSITITSHAKAVESATEKALQRAARMIGGTVEGHAKELCPVDTGLLRNSITFAIGGQAPNISEYQSNQRQGEETVTGKYEGTAPQDEDGQITVYVGTNVQYAPYQELGAPNINLPARPYLRPAMENFRDEIHQILEQQLKTIR